MYNSVGHNIHFYLLRETKQKLFKKKEKTQQNWKSVENLDDCRKYPTYLHDKSHTPHCTHLLSGQFCMLFSPWFPWLSFWSDFRMVSVSFGEWNDHTSRYLRFCRQTTDWVWWQHTTSLSQVASTPHGTRYPIHRRTQPLRDRDHTASIHTLASKKNNKNKLIPTLLTPSLSPSCQ